MLKKVYLGDWFFNAGIVGFYRILEDQGKQQILKIEGNYIEFDTNELKNFPDYYFNYFFEKYNIATKVNERIEENFQRIKYNFLNESPKSKDYIKNNKKFAKDTIKREMNKIKKFDQDAFLLLQENCDEIDKIDKDNLDDLDNIQKNIFNCLNKKEINEKITSNFFKNILSSSFFGQPSFLNVAKNSLNYEEQKKLFYKDYICNIIEEEFLNDIISYKFDIDEIKNQIENKDFNLLNDQISKIYKDILKQISKNKTIEEIIDNLKSKYLSDCTMCGEDNVLTTEYTEANFIPLAVSSENATNFFWNNKVKFPICNLCRLILFCIPAGVNSIVEIRKEIGSNGKINYNENNIYNFVDYDTNVEDLIKINNNFKNQSIKEKNNKNPYPELILNIVEQNKKISKWQIENIFVVEFDANYSPAYSRIKYFNINRKTATFFCDYSDKSLNRIRNYKFKLQIIDYILKNKDFKYIINERLRAKFKDVNNEIEPEDCYKASVTRMIFNMVKKGENMDNIDVNSKKLYVIYNIGKEQRRKLKEKGQENKLNGIVYKMLNYLKQENKNDFMDIVMRLHLSLEEMVSTIFINAIQDDDLSFIDVGQSYIAGLISDKVENRDNIE